MWTLYEIQNKIMTPQELGTAYLIIALIALALFIIFIIWVLCRSGDIGEQIGREAFKKQMRKKRNDEKYNNH